VEATATVTVTHRQGDQYVVEFSALPSTVFGPWDFTVTVWVLTVSAVLSPIDARTLVLDAYTNGSATAVRQVGLEPTIITPQT
jgi:hypothetical protein